MLNGIPFGSASGIVSDSDSEVKAVGELRLEFGFPSPPATAVAAAGVSQNQQLARVGVRSTTAAAILTGLGFEHVSNLKGGMLDWNKNKLAVERGEPAR